MAETRVLSVLERMAKAGIAEERARMHIAAGRVQIGDETVTDPDTPDDSEAGPGIHLDPA